LRDGGVPEPNGGGDLDRYFDGDLSALRRRRLLEDLAGERCEEVVRTNHALFRLKQPVDSIDVTDVVLQRVHARRAFLPRQLRSMIRAGRLGMAAVLLLSISSVVLLQRYNPGAIRLTAPDAPLSAVLEQSEQDTTAGLDTLSGGLDSIKRSLRVVAVDAEFERTSFESPGVESPGNDRRESAAQALVVFAAAGNWTPGAAALKHAGLTSDEPAVERRLAVSVPRGAGGFDDLVFTLDAGQCRPAPAMTAGVSAPRGVGPANTSPKWRVTPIVRVSAREPMVVSPAPVSLNLRGPVLELLSGSGDVSAIPAPTIDR